MSEHCTSCGVSYYQEKKRRFSGRAILRAILGTIGTVLYSIYWLFVFFPVFISFIYFVRFIGWVYERDESDMRWWYKITDMIQVAKDEDYSDKVIQTMVIVFYGVAGLIQWAIFIGMLELVGVV